MPKSARCSTIPSITRTALLASVSLGILASFSPASATALPDFLSFATAGDFTGWTRVNGVVATSQTFSTTLGDGNNGDKIIRTYNLTPAAGQYMAIISTSGNTLSNIGKDGVVSTSNSLRGAESVFGLTANTFSTLFSSLSGNPTNYGAMIESTTLTAGTTYTFYWSYAAQDYQAYNDGVFFSLTGNGLNEVSVLASNGGTATDPNGGGAQVGTQVLGSFGATQWASFSFTVATTGVYELGFGAYNWGTAANTSDQSVNPLFFVGASAGTVTTPSSSTPIDTNAAYYAISNLGTSVDPDFKGGTLRIDTTAATSTNFTVEAYAGNAIDSYGHIGLFSGVLSGTGGLTIKDTAGGGKVVFAGTNLYSGGTTILAGGTLQIGAGGTTGSVVGNIANNGTLAFNRSDSITYAGNITGTGSLIQAGSGTLILTGASVYSGGTVVNTGGTLQLGNGGATGTIIGDITNNGTLIYNNSGGIGYTSVISGSGNLIKQTASTLTLLATNTYTGGTTISAGTLQIGNGGTTGSVVGNITNNAALIFNRSNSLTYSGVISGSGTLGISGGGTVVLTGTNTYTGGTTITAGTLQIGAGGTTGSVVGNITNNAGLIFNRSNSLTYSGVISGSGTLGISGGGTVVLTGANTYTGTTTIASGSTLQIGDGGTTGSIVSDVSNQGILAFNRSDTVTFSGTVTGDGTLVQNGTGKVIVTTNYTGKTIVNSGTLQIGNGSTSGTVAGNIVNNATVVYGQAASTSYTGVISGTGGVSVAGGGVVILNSSNTYTGPTTVTAGALVIGDISHPAGAVLGNVTVSSSGIVGGYGTIGGNLTAGGGTVSPGNSIGTLTVKGDYTQSSASTLKIEISPTANDELVVQGSAQLGGALQLVVTPGTYTTRAYTFLTANSITGTFDSVTYSGATSDMVYSVVYGSQEVDLAVTPKASGQIYGDILTQSFDTVVMLNGKAVDHLHEESEKGWNLWSKALSGASQTKGDENGATFNSQLWGVISGAEYQFAGGSKLGAVFSYTHTQLGVHDQGDKASANGYYFSLTGHIPVKDFIVDLSGFLQRNIIDVTRSNGTFGYAVGHDNNLVGGGSVQIGYPMGDILPFARLTVATFDGDDFTEAGTLGLSIGSLTRNTARGTFGIEVSHNFTSDDGTIITPRFVVGGEGEFSGDKRDVTMSFGGTEFEATAPEPRNFSALVSAGLNAKLNQKLEFTLEADGMLSANQQQAVIGFGAKYRF